MDRDGARNDGLTRHHTRREHESRSRIGTYRQNLSVMCVASGAVLAGISFAIRMLAQVIVEILRQRGGISGDFSTLQAVPDGDTLVVGVLGRRRGGGIGRVGGGLELIGRHFRERGKDWRKGLEERIGEGGGVGRRWITVQYVLVARW